MLSWVEQEKSFITSGPGYQLFAQALKTPFLKVTGVHYQESKTYKMRGQTRLYTCGFIQSWLFAYI